MIRGRCLGSLVMSSALVLAGCPDEEPVCADCFDNDGYEIELSSLPDDTKPPGAVLFSGWRNGSCQNDVVCTGTPDVFLGDVRWGDVKWSRDCNDEDQEVIAFAGGYEPFVATPQVPPGAGLELAGTVVPVSFQPPRKIDVKIWVVVPYPATPTGRAQAHAMAAALLTPAGQTVTARRVYTDLGTGIDLHFTSDTFPSQGFADNNLRSLYESASCFLVTPITSRGTTGYDPAQLNVYYVDWLQGNRPGENCFTSGQPNIMFVAGTANYSAFTLAHEIGHALGLQRSTTVPGGGFAAAGDIDEMLLDGYLGQDNLMRSGGDEARQVTLGQIYRMHYDELSWRWKQPNPPTGASSYPRPCQNSPVAGGPCPPLTLHPARGWP